MAESSKEKLLKREEGFSAVAYLDSLGYPTIGYGTLIGPKGAPLKYYTQKITEDIALLMARTEMSDNLVRLQMKSWFNELDEDKQIIIESMAYQLGFAGLLKFGNMIKALTVHDYKEAEKEALDSLWASKAQTPERAKRHAAVLGGKSINEVYK